MDTPESSESFSWVRLRFLRHSLRVLPSLRATFLSAMDKIMANLLGLYHSKYTVYNTVYLLGRSFMLGRINLCLILWVVVLLFIAIKHALNGLLWVCEFIIEMLTNFTEEIQL